MPCRTWHQSAHDAEAADACPHSRAGWWWWWLAKHYRTVPTDCTAIRRCSYPPPYCHPSLLHQLTGYTSILGATENGGLEDDEPNKKTGKTTGPGEKPSGVLLRGVTNRHRRPRNAGGGQKGQGGPLPLGKRNFSTRPRDVDGAGGRHMKFSAGGRKFEVGPLVLLFPSPAVCRFVVFHSWIFCDLLYRFIDLCLPTDEIFDSL